MKLKVYDDFQNRHLNLFFRSVCTLRTGVRSWGETFLPSSSESGGVGSPDVPEVGSSSWVIMLSFDRRVAFLDNALSDDGW